MEKLISILKDIQNNIDKYEIVDGEDEDYGLQFLVIKDEQIKDELEELSCSLFICMGGYPNRENCLKFKQLTNGEFYIAPGEKDSSGWVTGTIRSRDGLVYYVFG